MNLKCPDFRSDAGGSKSTCRMDKKPCIWVGRGVWRVRLGLEASKLITHTARGPGPELGVAPEPSEQACEAGPMGVHPFNVDE